MMIVCTVQLDNLINYDKENIPETCLKAIQPYLDDAEFEPEYIRAKSLADNLLIGVIDERLREIAYQEVERAEKLLKYVRKLNCSLHTSF